MKAGSPLMVCGGANYAESRKMQRSRTYKSHTHAHDTSQG